MGQRYFFVSPNSIIFYAQLRTFSPRNEKKKSESYVEGNGASVSDLSPPSYFSVHLYFFVFYTLSVLHIIFEYFIS